MFSSLSPSAGTERTESANSVLLSEAELAALIDNLADVPVATTSRRLRNRTKCEVQALISAIEAHGVAPSLLAFANHNGKLGAAVASIPALESLSTDLSDTVSAQILAGLKALIVPEEPAQEGLGVFQWIITIIGLWSGILPGIVAYIAFTLWNDNEDRKKEEAELKRHPERAATVLPYSHIVTGLHGISAAPAILKTIIATPLPANEKAYHDDFVPRIRNETKGLEDIGIYVGTENGEDILDVGINTTPVRRDIEKLGYTEVSLSHIAALARDCEQHEHELHLIQEELRKLHALEHDADARHSSTKAIRLITEIVHATLTRTVKLLQQTKHTCQEIEHFYRKA